MSSNTATSGAGAVTSLIITFWVWVLIFPLLSSNVQVTTVVPWAVIGSTVVVVPVIVPEQLSVAVGAVNVSTLHSAVMSSNTATSGACAVTSSITTFWVWVLIFPRASSNVQVTTVVPWAVIGSTVVVVPVIVPAQLSVAVGAVNVSTLQSAVTSAKFATSATGAVVSTTVIVWV